MSSMPAYAFRARTAALTAAADLQQVAIYRIKKDGTLAARPTIHEPAYRVATRIASLEKLNPGTRYTVLDDHA